MSCPLALAISLARPNALGWRKESRVARSSVTFSTSNHLATLPGGCGPCSAPRRVRERLQLAVLEEDHPQCTPQHRNGPLDGLTKSEKSLYPLGLLPVPGPVSQGWRLDPSCCSRREGLGREASVVGEGVGVNARGPQADGIDCLPGTAGGPRTPPPEPAQPGRRTRLRGTPPSPLLFLNRPVSFTT